MTSFRETVNRAADNAGLSVKNQVATNSFSLLVHTMIELGQLKLPHGAIGVLSDVLKERTGHAVPGGSLRWYRVQIMKDPEYVARFVKLPPAFDLLVRTGQPA